jgi:hypothetical protein
MLATAALNVMPALKRTVVPAEIAIFSFVRRIFQQATLDACYHGQRVRVAGPCVVHKAHHWLFTLRFQPNTSFRSVRWLQPVDTD